VSPPISRRSDRVEVRRYTVTSGERVIYAQSLVFKSEKELDPFVTLDDGFTKGSRTWSRAGDVPT
jgi:hypothetical protein